mgnify:CR=1 FL=1
MDSLLDKGYKIAATYGRDWHREEASGHYGCTYVDVDDISAKSAMRAIRLGKTVISHGAKFIFRVHRHGVTSGIGDTGKKGNYTFSFFTDLHSRAKDAGDEDIVYKEIKIVTNGGKCVLETRYDERHVRLRLAAVAGIVQSFGALLTEKKSRLQLPLRFIVNNYLT